MYDLIVIGMGISGITAGIYAKRSNLNVLIIDKSMPGGLLNSIETISNYPGLSNISGSDFAMNLFNQVNELKIPYKLEEVQKVDLLSDVKSVTTNTDIYKAKNIIIATGRKPKYLGLDNEKSFLGRGLSTCAVCDGDFYKGKTVAVVGSGNSALQESLYLAKVAEKVYIINRRDGFKGEDALIDKIKNNNHDNIEIIYNVNIKKINEENEKISSITLDNDTTIDVSGVFIYIGFTPNSDLVKDLDITNMDGYILVGDDFETTIPRVYAIGDVIKKDVYQLVTAASDGALVIYSIQK
ncbi:MAG: FAD-dependent oxidoreductase [Bacilli bacterium]